MAPAPKHSFIITPFVCNKYYLLYSHNHIHNKRRIRMEIIISTGLNEVTFSILSQPFHVTFILDSQVVCLQIVFVVCELSDQ